uniref:Reverse transcriptase zinc-binding domain-containing protein n=1 Tax=Chenopodium quinoa TaxID=63459 RepID=A0A803MR67_CHEQI
MIHLPTASWDANKINELFLPFERERIPSIHLSCRLSEDSICWDLEKEGEYSVLFAYSAIFGEYNVENEASTSGGTNLWNKIWHANTLPRVNVFVWRACKGALPTLAGLSRSLPKRDVTCSLCEAEPETDMFNSLTKSRTWLIYDKYVGLFGMLVTGAVIRDDRGEALIAAAWMMEDR